MHGDIFLCFGVIRMKIQTAYTSGRLTVSLIGELDHHEARKAMESIEEAMDAAMPREIILDMSELGFMDSSGIAVILKMQRKLSITDGRMLINCPQAQPLKVLDAAGIGRIIPIKTKWEVTT